MDAEWVRLSLMAICSTVAAVAVTYFTPSTNENILISFYKQIKPVGFWQKTATLANDNPFQPQKDFIQELKTTFLTALSLFLMLIGTGKLLIRLPGESSLLAWGCIIVAVVLIRTWWRNSLVGRINPFYAKKQ